MLETRIPKIANTIDIFKWWLHTSKKEKPYLETRNYAKIRKANMLSKHLDVSILSINKKELNYLRKKLLTIDAEIIILEQSDLYNTWFTAITHKIFGLKKEIGVIKERIKYLEKAPSDGFTTIMTYKTFCTIIEKYNKKVAKALIEEGVSVKLGNNLGYLYILKKKKEDMFALSNIDWEESKKFKEELILRGDVPKDKEHPEGKNWFQFYEDPDYLRVAWAKKYGVCKVPNNVVYAFYPTKSTVGIVKQLIDANRKNVYLKEKYITVIKKKF